MLRCKLNSWNIHLFHKKKRPCREQKELMYKLNIIIMKWVW